MSLSPISLLCDAIYPLFLSTYSLVNPIVSSNLDIECINRPEAAFLIYRDSRKKMRNTLVEFSLRLSEVLQRYRGLFCSEFLC